MEMCQQQITITMMKKISFGKNSIQTLYQVFFIFPPGTPRPNERPLNGSPLPPLPLLSMVLKKKKERKKGKGKKKKNQLPMPPSCSLVTNDPSPGPLVEIPVYLSKR